MSKQKITNFIQKSNFFIGKALIEAKIAYYKNEIPVGAIIIYNNKIITKAHNQTETKNNFICHAEILAIKEACAYLGSKYLNQCSIYITLEPCFMCLHALYLCRINKIYYGAFNYQENYVQQYLKYNNKFKTEIYGGIKEKECAKLLKNFFKKEII